MKPLKDLFTRKKPDISKAERESRRTPMHCPPIPASQSLPLLPPPLAALSSGISLAVREEAPRAGGRGGT